MSPEIYSVIYSDTSSTNISKSNIFHIDYLANLDVIIAGENTSTSVPDLVNTSV